MLSYPRLGQAVQCWYASRVRAARPFHGKIGHVVIVGRGRPRNHGVLIDGTMVVVPCGNLRLAPDHRQAA